MKPGDIIITKKADIHGAGNRIGDRFKLVAKVDVHWYVTEVEGFKYSRNISSMPYRASMEEDGEEKFYNCFIFPDDSMELLRKEELLTE